MKQVEQNVRTGALDVGDAPVPMVRAGTVLVRSHVSLVSPGTERRMVEFAKSSLAGKAMARPDLVRQVIRKARQEGVRSALRNAFAKLDTALPLGYSLCGRIVEVGSEVEGLKIGDRVACAGAGVANHAEYNVVPKRLCVPVPDTLADEDAAFVTLGAVALQAVRVAAPALGETVVVLGLGLVGQLIVQLLAANGCRVLGFDPDPVRAALAEHMGAVLGVSEGLEEAVRGFTRGQGADAVIVAAASPSSEPLNAAAGVSRMKGRVVLVGMVGMRLDREPFYRRELELRLSMSYGPGRHDPEYEKEGRDYPFGYVRWTEQRNMEAFLELVAAGRVTPRRLVTHRFPVEEAGRAYELIESEASHMAVLLSYPLRTGARIERRILLDAARLETGGDALRVGFIGFGAHAKSVLLPALKSADRRVVLTAVATSSGLSARHAAMCHGFAVAASDPSEILGDPATDAVLVATRHASHASLSVAALRAGKHVFCEKPLGLTQVELEAVIEAARSGGSVFTVGFNRRFAPLMTQAKAALQERAGPLVMSYRINAGLTPPDSWITGPEGGGRILGEVCHYIDALSYLAGAAVCEVQAVSARDAPDAVSILLAFRDGSTGTIVYSPFGHPELPKERLEVLADGRAVQLDDFRRLSILTPGRRATVRRRSQDKGQTALLAAFLGAARGLREPPIPLPELAATTEATFAVEESLRARAPATVRLWV